MGRNLTNEEFLNKIKNTEYDLSKIKYVNAKTKIEVVCKSHGSFFILPGNFLNGHGCPICRYIKSAAKQTMDKTEFIRRANIVHKNKYVYSKVNYIKNSTKVCIICPEHGEFWQRPCNHVLRKQGCPSCSGNKKMTRDEFIEKGNKIHNYNFNYSKVEYLNNQKKVCIICPEHGEFWQRPHDHLHGQGCPYCNKSKIEKEIAEELTRNNIKFYDQFRYDDNNKKNRLDFYLPDYNIAIECQGEQHFKPVDFAGNGLEWAKKNYQLNKLRDLKKFYKCKSQGITILYYVKNKQLPNGFRKEKIYATNLYTDKEKLVMEIKKRGF